jgi:hypothetical protein
MNTSIVEKINSNCLISHRSNKSKTNRPPITVKRFRETKNRCYSLVISKHDMKNLVLNGQRLHLNEKLEGFNFLTVGQVLQKARAQEPELTSLEILIR